MPKICRRLSVATSNSSVTTCFEFTSVCVCVCVCVCVAIVNSFITMLTYKQNKRRSQSNYLQEGLVWNLTVRRVCCCHITISKYQFHIENYLLLLFSHVAHKRWQFWLLPRCPWSFIYHWWGTHFDYRIMREMNDLHIVKGEQLVKSNFQT